MFPGIFVPGLCSWNSSFCSYKTAYYRKRELCALYLSIFVPLEMHAPSAETKYLEFTWDTGSGNIMVDPFTCAAMFLQTKCLECEWDSLCGVIDSMLKG